MRALAGCAQPSWIEKTHIELLGQAVNSASDIFELTNPQAAYEHVNPAFERVLGFSPDEALGKMASDLIRSDYHDSEYFSEIKRCLDAGESWSGVIVSGTGLGLAISQRFVDMMQGSLDFTSALGEGATFVVTIPLIQTCKSCVTTGCGGPSTGPTVLVIDDDMPVFASSSLSASEGVVFA